jgi:hypothetical protein
MGRFVARWLDLPEGQGARAARMLALVFALSAGLSLIKSAQSGVFLAAYPRTMIPWAFACSSVLLSALSALGVRASARLGTSRLAAVSLLTTIVSLLALRALLATSLGVVPFILYVVIEAASGVLVIQVWAVAAAATDARTGRKLLPVAGIGASLAWTLSGVLVRPLVSVVGANGLLLAAPVVFGIAWALVLAIERSDLAHHDRIGAGSRGGSVREALRFVYRVPLLRMMAVLSLLSLVAEEVMDFHVMSTARAELGDADAIAVFFGHYYAVTSLLGMVFLAGPAARVLSGLGASRALLVTPLVTAVVASVASVIPGLAAAVALRGTGRVLKQALWSNAQEQMQTPIAHRRRAQARAATRGVLAPAGYAAAALILAALPAHVDSRWLAFVVLVISLAMVVVIAGQAKGAYRRALHRAVDERRLRLGVGGARRSFDLDDKTHAAAVAAIEADSADAALGADLLAAARQPDESALLLALAHRSPDVRRVAARAVGLRSTPAAMNALSTALSRETSPDVVDALLAAVRHAVGHTPTLRAHPGLATAVGHAGENGDARLRSVARVVEAGLREEGVALGAALLPAIAGTDRAARSAALAELTREAALASGVQAQMRALLMHGDADAKVEVAEAVIALGLMTLLPDVVVLLREPAVGARVARLLVELGDDAFDGSGGAGGLSTIASLTRMAARLAERPTAATSGALVKRLLVHKDRSIRRNAARAFAAAVRSGRRPPMTQADLTPLVIDEARACFSLTSILAGLAQDDGVPDWTFEPEFRWLASEIELRVEASRSDAMTLLSLTGQGDELVSAIEASRRAPSAERDAQVAELLEVALPSELSRCIVPLFERLSLRERVETATRLDLLDREALAHPLDAIVSLGEPYLRRAAALTYGARYSERFPDLHAEDVPLLDTFARARFLRSVPLFAGVPGDDLLSIAEVLEVVELETHEVVFHKGEPGEDLYLVCTGRISIDDGAVRIAELGEREFFGDLAVIDHQPRSADATAIGASTLYRLRGADLRELMASRPEIALGVVRVLAARLRDASQKVAARPSGG